jgi:hypothetical protein
VDVLAKSIKDTLRALHTPEQPADSPVFLLLPELTPPNPADLTVVPEPFQVAIEKAEHDPTNAGTTLALLAEEGRRNRWGREGLRLVGRAQRRISSFPAALETWESIRKYLPNDVEANLQLATIYQRLGDFVSSSHACRRVIDSADADRKDRADARSQLGRNAKALWIRDFKNFPNVEARRRYAIADKRLRDAFQGYREGFAEDMNDYYSGINALGMLTAIVELAEIEADAWASVFPSRKRAANELEIFQDKLGSLRGAVRTSLDNAKFRAERTGQRDEWLPPSEAQYALLTSDNSTFVRTAYNDARNADRIGHAVKSEAQQVAIFLHLGLFVDNCREALGALNMTLDDLEKTEYRSRDRVIVATGHRIDAPERSPPGRFPNTPECIAKARAWLREAIEAEMVATAGSMCGIAGAASGTDLLFHDVCKELGIPTSIVLPIPVEDYRRKSVADAGPDWIEQFNRLIAEQSPIVLSDEDAPPSWTETIPDYSVFQRGNIWMMENALLRAGADVTLIALWDGKAGNGPGGTADMVKLAREHGAKLWIKDSAELFGIGA